MRVYCSGPMTGHSDLNRPAFDAAERRLSERGHFVINPVNISCTFGTPKELAEAFAAAYAKPWQSVGSYEEHARKTCLANAVMDADLAAVRSCDAIYLLRGWENSRGARMELAEALKHGLQVMQGGGEECA